MIRQYRKGTDERLTPNFWIREFHCACHLPACTTTYLSDDLVIALQRLRDHVGPLTVLSGFRCAAHNQKVGGSVNSQHLLGIAADVWSPKVKPEALRDRARKILGFSQGGIGLYHWGVHLDVRGKPARWIG